MLDELCRAPGDGRGPVTNTELAKLVGDLGGEITDGYISHLRKGHRDNPTLQTICDLAAALRVSPAVFVGGRREPVSGRSQLRRSFSGKLRHLFAHVYPPDRGPYTPEEVARAISEDGRYASISASYIRELLQPPPDTLPNPRWKHLLGLADHLGLADKTGPKAAYFLDDAEAEVINAELADFVALRDAGVVTLVMRVARHAPDWTPEVRSAAVAAITDAMQSKGPTWTFPVSDEPDLSGS